MTDPTPTPPPAAPSTTSTIVVKAHANLKDMTGQRFGMLTVVSRAKNRQCGGARWNCDCDCGNKTISAGASLRKGQKDCGCLTVKMLRSRAIDGMIGKKFGKLTVIEFDRKAPGSYELIFTCACNCGERVSVSNATLRRGGRTHCGCSAKNLATFDNVPDRYKVSELDKQILRRVRMYKGSAKSRGLPFSLSFATFKLVILGNCFYCGAIPSLSAHGGWSTKKLIDSEIVFTNGVDRIDSKVGYVDGNVVSCCEMCNKMKLHHSGADFFKHIERICNHNTPEPVYLGC
jgi:hypothetical protein